MKPDKIITNEKGLQKALSKSYDKQITIEFKSDTALIEPVTIPKNMTLIINAPYGKIHKIFFGEVEMAKSVWWGKK